MLDFRWRHADARRGPARSGARGSHEGIRSVIDVQHGALGALKQHGLPFSECAVQEICGIADVAANLFAELQGFFHFVGKIDVRAVSALRQPVFFRHHVGGFFSKQFRFQQIAHAQAAARHFVFVRRADSTRSGADFVCAARYFCGFIQFAVIGKNQVGAVADVEPPADVYASLRKRFNLGH